MNRGIYATATGMLTSQQWMDTIANNLANASTTGYKRDSLNFNEAMLRQMSVGSHSIGSMGAGPRADQTYTIFAQGSLQRTGNPLDIAIRSEHGLFAVQSGNDTLYTRDGSFGVSSTGQLVNKDGLPVLNDQKQPIQVPEGAVKVAEDGQITVDGKEVAKIGVFDVQRSDPSDAGFHKVGNNLYTADRTAQASDIKMQSGTLEASNVDAIDSMVQMISLSRAFEMAQRSIQSQDELSQRLIQSLQDR